MFRRLPKDYSKIALSLFLENAGFGDTFDLIHVSQLRSTGKKWKFAIVNFVNASWASRCIEMFGGLIWSGRETQNDGPTVVVAPRQGLENNIAFVTAQGKRGRKKGTRG